MISRDRIHENEFFRFQQCGLSVQEAAQLCCVNVSVVEEWDKGKRIPPVCRRLMSIYGGRDLEFAGWYGWSIHPHRMIMPSGEFVTPGQIEKWFALYGDSYHRYRSPVRRKLMQSRFKL